MKSASLQYANALADIALAQGAGDPAAKQLTPKAQESLINNFVKTLEGRPN